MEAELENDLRTRMRLAAYIITRGAIDPRRAFITFYIPAALLLAILVAL